jgi:hypothetical protein
MKKFLAFVLGLAMVMSLSGCFRFVSKSDKDETEKTNGTTTSASEKDASKSTEEDESEPTGEDDTPPESEKNVIEFDGLELTFGEYSFTEIDNMYSEYDKQKVVKIPVTVKNISDSPNSLNMFYYNLYGTSGTESANIGYYFSDDVMEGGNILSGKSYTRYFHILYDGDGVYTIAFDNYRDEKIVEINVKK